MEITGQFGALYWDLGEIVEILEEIESLYGIFECPGMFGLISGNQQMRRLEDVGDERRRRWLTPSRVAL